MPIDEVLPDVLRAARTGTFVLVAPPGAGKTTRVPPALAGQVEGQVLLLEPRRVAARAAARRMASEAGEPVGRAFGWQVRFERSGGPDARIWALTEGILLRRLQDDPLLEGVGAVLLDEVHERGLEVDLCLALLREVREARPELVIGAMSATFDPAPVAAFLGDATVVSSEGRAFPVSVEHLRFPDERPIPEVTADGVRRVLAEGDGDVLVFLPGVGEIRRTIDALAGCGCDLVPLYGDLSPEEQDRALRPGERRRVVLATNVAETSVTVPGVTAVVDSGRVRRASRDPGTGLDRLDLAWVSRASADQRAGRAGRTAPGRALRLWTARHHQQLVAEDPPEILRLDLAGPTLQLLAWGADPRTFGWLDAPPEAAVDDALAVLRDVGALDDGGLTSLGRRMAAMPLHPRLARLVLDGGPRAALAAAVLSERGTPGASVDLEDRLAHPSEPALRVAKRLRGHTSGHDDPERLRRAVLAAWPDRVARRRHEGSPRARLVGGRGVVLGGPGVEEELFVCVEVRDATPEATVRTASPVDPSWLTTVTEVVTAWDEESAGVRARRVVRYRDLVLRSTTVAADPLEAEALLLDVLRARPELAVPERDDDVALMVRWGFAHGLVPDRVPERDPASLLPALVAGRRTLREVREASWEDALQAAHGYAALAAIEQLAPVWLTVPSGSRIRLRWEEGRPPVLAVRIQELFGLRDTPTVGAGRARVLLHLLAPNHRPQQVTDDLAGFWERTWPEVRKELRARYPKHAWPDDPLAASPESRPQRRR
ncbi:MAG: ATP-dependent helicase HrpB [Alphaproteobacteria bacterium]|nr:ATP-dependent helicase HrpB [Alphaproteobacteria bacterium]MCB9696802.1 ATP-dependent helicase HrpB [Alphaproteobacteria bacterium]